jgi:hypothetical protein
MILCMMSIHFLHRDANTLHRLKNSLLRWALQSQSDGHA